MFNTEILKAKEIIKEYTVPNTDKVRLYINKVELAKITKDLKANTETKTKIPFLKNDVFSVLCDKNTKFFIENEELKTSLAPEQANRKELLAYIKTVLELIK